MVPRGKERALLSSVVRSAADAIVGCDTQGRITAWNPAAERIYGYRRDEVHLRPVTMMYPPDVAERDWEVFQKALRGTPTTQVRTVRLRSDGTRVPVRMSFAPIEGVDGSVRGVVSVAHELTGEIQSEARMAALLEAVPDAITAIDADGRIVMANQGTEQLLGYPRERLLNQSYAALLAENEIDRFAPVVAELFGSPQHRTVVYVDVVRSDGVRVPTENTVTRFHTGGQDVLLVVGRDITDRIAAERERVRLTEQVERQRTEQAMLRAQRLEALGQLAGGVAHDFNNLLAIISNYAGLLADDVGDLARADPGQWQAYVDDLARIQQAAQRGSTLTQQLLTFSRRDLNRPQVLAPATVLENLQPLLESTVGEQHELRIEMAGGLWPVLLDPGQMEQILVNLTANARDAMPDGGLVRISADNRCPSEEDPACQPASEPGCRYVRIRVTDTGAGMPPEVAARAFEPFFTTKPKSQGAGLGLATVHGVVGQAGGCLALESEPGTGTTVTVLLPATDQPPPEPVFAPGTGHADGPEDGDAGRQRLILLVDDEQGVRESTARVLTRHGYRVVTAFDGHHALEVVTEQGDEIDILLTDVIMPRMHGGELADRVTALIPGIRVVFMSGYAEPLLGTDPAAHRSVRLLEKPFTTTDLLQAVRSATAGDRSPA